MADKTITVNDIRAAIMDLSDDALVIVKAQTFDEWGSNGKCCIGAVGAHDGRFGQVLCLQLGGFVEPFNAGGVEDVEVQDKVTE